MGGRGGGAASSSFGSQVAGSIPPKMKLSILLTCATFFVRKLLLQFPLPRPAVRRPPGRNCAQQSEHQLAIKPGLCLLSPQSSNAPCALRKFRLAATSKCSPADSSVTGEKADTSAMPVSASSTAPPSNAEPQCIRARWWECTTPWKNIWRKPLHSHAPGTPP